MSNCDVPRDDMIDVDRNEILEYLNKLLVKPVLLAWPLGVKGAPRKWGNITYETIKWSEIKQAVMRGGNIGVVLGPLSGNLVAMDLDSDKEMDQFFEFARWAKNSLISIGSKGCQVWFYMEGWYPPKREIWKYGPDERPIVEFRTGVQSIIWGKNPDSGGRYTTNGKQPLRISYYELAEYRAYLRTQGAEVDEDSFHKEEKEDFEWAAKKYKGCFFKDLDLLGLLKEAKIQYKLIGEEEDRIRYAITCPWKNEHTSGDGERDAAIHIFEPRGTWWPQFTCFHSHCHDRKLKDLLGWLEREHDMRPGTVRRYCSGDPKKVEVKDATELIEAPPAPEPIIDGLLYPELKMLIASSSKIGKTWIGIDLALSLASGSMWMGFDTCQSRVLYLNLEMPTVWFERRICEIKAVRNMTILPKGSFKYANLRGSSLLEGNLDALFDICKEHGPFDVIIYDPIYKLLGDLDENKATDVAKLLRMIDEVGRVTGAASVPIHHYAKGDAWLKKAGDRASGSGVFLRDPDAYMGVTELGEEDSGTARVDFRLRVSRKVESFGIRWDNYQWKRDPTVEISKSKGKEGKSKEPTVAEKILQVLRDNSQGLTYTQWKNMVVVRGITTERSFENNAAELKKAKQITQKDKLYFVF